VAVAAPASGGAAYADTSVALPLTGFRAMVVDAAHVYLTGSGPASLLVTDLAGGSPTTVPDLPGASGLAFSADGSVLYVALADGDAIAAVDTATLVETARYATGTATCPSQLGVAAGKIWFGYGCAGRGGGLGSLDPSGTDPVVTLGLATFLFAPLIATAPGSATMAVAGSVAGTSTVRLFTVASGSPVQVAERGDACKYLAHLSMTPDGQRVLLACFDLQNHQALSATDLSSAATYQSDLGQTAIAASTDSRFVVAASATISVTGRAPSVYLFVARTDGTPVRSYDLHVGDPMPFGGLATAPTGTVYAVTTGSFGVAYLHILPGAALPPVSITFSSPATAPRKSPLTVTGRLSSAETPIESAQPLTVTKQDLTGAHALPSIVAAADGSFSFGDTPAVGGPNVYTVSYAGDATHAAVSSKATVEVSRLPVSLTITANATTYPYLAAATVTAHLGTTHDSRSICIYAQATGGTRKALACGTVNASGNLAASTVMLGRKVFTAEFAGDQWYAHASVSRTALATPRIRTALSGYYASAGAYRIYRSTVDPGINVTFAPARPGACIGYLAQVYQSGVWHNVSSVRCFTLNQVSNSYAAFGGPHLVGVPYRLRASFGGDAYNAPTTGAWQNLKFTR
jgi:hypothetical protein